MNNINSNYIVRSIDRTCDILGGIDQLRVKGFYNTMNYVEIVRGINEQPFENVLSILKNLIMDGNVYAEFANHLLEAGLLDDKFFELDDNFNPTKNNLSLHLRLESYGNDDDGMELDNISHPVVERDAIKEEIDKIEREARRIYDKNSLKTQTISPSINSQVLSEIRSKISPEVNSWLESNIKNMSDEDYGNFMVYIAYNRNR